MKYNIIKGIYGEYWFKHGTNIEHREAGAARICIDGYKSWYQEDKRHREVGPAVIYYNGSKGYWIDGEPVK